MDFLKELAGSRKYTFHSHTQFCDGRAQMEAFAREAVARGFTHYGFSPHCPIPIESPCNMRSRDVGVYLQEVERIRREYGSACRFYASMEVDYLGEKFGPSHPDIVGLGLDYVIGSVHFIPDHEGREVDIDGRFESFSRKMEQHFRGDIRYVVETFYSRSMAMVDAGGFDIIGHLDKVGQNASYFRPGIEQEAWYQDQVNALIDKVISRGDITVEINTKAYAEHGGRLFPHPRHWGRLLDAGVPLIVNSDAHVPALIDASRDIVFSMLEGVGR